MASNNDGNMEETSSPGRRGWRFYAALAGICQVNLIVAFDSSAISAALPIISSELDATGIEAFWIGTSFLLSSTVFQPAFTSLSHLFGRSVLMLAALTFFTAGCVVAGWAHNIAVFLAGRTLQGVGGGGIMALSSLLMADLFPLRERAKWTSLINLIWAVGTAAGPPGAGALAQVVTWRWIFWLNLPFCGIAFVIIPTFLKLKHAQGTIWSKLGSFDWVGFSLFTVSSTSFLLGIVWGGTEFPWASWQTLVPILLGAAIFVIFAFYDVLISSRPFINFSIFSNYSVNCAFISTLLQNAIIFALLYYLPLYGQAVHGFGALKSGIALIPNTVAVTVAAASAGVLISRFGRYLWAVWLGWTLTVLGTSLLLIFKLSSSDVELILLPIVLGLGLGSLVTGLYCSGQASVIPEHQALCGAMFTLLRLVGQTLGVAAGAAIFQNQIQSRLEKSALPASQAADLARMVSSLVDMIHKLPDNSPLKQELLDVFQGSFEVFIYVMCAIAATGIALSLGIRGYSLDQRHVTDQLFESPLSQENELGEKSPSTYSTTPSSSGTTITLK